MNKLILIWKDKDGKRIIITTTLVAIVLLILIALIVLFALLDNILLGYRLLMIAPCVIYSGTIGYYLYKQINIYKSLKANKELGQGSDNENAA